jgi:FkbM family methyltransferase
LFSFGFAAIGAQRFRGCFFERNNARTLSSYARRILPSFGPLEKPFSKYIALPPFKRGRPTQERKIVFIWFFGVLAVGAQCVGGFFLGRRTLRQIAFPDTTQSSALKNTIKKILKALPFAFTQNQRYDRLTQQVIRKVCRPDSHCVDVGCHKGEILDLFLRAAPRGTHYGFEPIPELYHSLRAKYAAQPNCQLFDIALSNQAGTASFNYVVSNPSYSGLLKRRYDRPNETDTLITVRTEKLDAVLPPEARVDVLKIDVEGGELMVLEGAVSTLTRCKPLVIFEHGLGASEVYGSTPARVFGLLESCGLRVSLLDHFLAGKPPLALPDFERQYHQKLNYYFVAY